MRREPIRVGIVEDDPMMRRLLRRALEHDGRFAVVSEAGDGAEAIELAELVELDLLLVDLDLPGVDGLGVIDALKQSRHRPRAVVVLTGVRDETLRRAAVVGGADAWIVKGGDPLRLLDEIADAYLAVATPSVA